MKFGLIIIATALFVSLVHALPAGESLDELLSLPFTGSPVESQADVLAAAKDIIASLIDKNPTS
jgi:hypothetical protein